MEETYLPCQMAENEKVPWDNTMDYRTEPMPFQWKKGESLQSPYLLTTEEILLLENLMYLPDQEQDGLKPLESGEGISVGELVESMDWEHMPGCSGEDSMHYCDDNQTHSKEDSENYVDCMAGDGWRKLLSAIRQNDRLMKVRIHQVFRDVLPGGGGGLGAVFFHVPAGEAVVAFRGTAREEWKDNFQGGGYTSAADRVSTIQQMRALSWYQSLELSHWFVTVTGHSKGGNKAKYITILDDTVDRCLSFDGQGFSDEFMEWYRVRILLRQHRIENHNVENDYVHLLLNDVGASAYYKGQVYKKGDFLKNHCPNAFLLPGRDGKLHMERSEEGQTKALYWLGRFLTGYLKSLTRRKKLDLLDLLGELAEKLAGGEPKERLLLTFLEEQHRDMAAEFVEYAFAYGEKHPEFVCGADWLLEQTGLGKLVWAVRLFRRLRENG